MGVRVVAASALLLGVLTSGCSAGNDSARIREAVVRQMTDYPCSTLCDIYKSFFQDRFGPGHIVTDREAAARYLRREMDEAAGDYGCALGEPAGCGDNFWRVSIEVIASGAVPFDTYLDAFMRSVRNVEPVEVEAWRGEWRRIESVVEDLYPDLPALEEDRRAIESLLGEGRYAWHHSRAYNEHYRPHYRLIRRDIFERELLPLIEAQQ